MANLEDLRIDSPIPKPRRRKPSPLPWVIALALGGWAVWYFFGERVQKLTVAVQPARSVQVYSVPAQQGPEGSFTAGGYLEVIPPGPAVVSALIDGQVRELRVKPGDRVSAGQLVARLDGSLLEQDVVVQRSQVELARANLTQMQAGFRSEEIQRAEADLAQAHSRLFKAQADHGRYITLLDQGIVSRAEFDIYEAALRQAEGDVAAREAELALLRAGQRTVDIDIARRQVDSAQAQLARAQTVLGKCAIKAPVSGVVLDVFVQPGGWVSPTDGTDHAGQVCSIFDPQQVQAWVDVNQRDIARVSVGQKVTLVTDALPDEQIAGTVSAIMPAASIEKNTVRVKIALGEHSEHFRPGMSAQVTFVPAYAAAAEQPVGVEVPRSAVLQEGDSARVFVIVGGAAQSRTVQLGAERGDNVLLTSGVGAGDQVIANPEGISEGMKVQAEGHSDEQ